MSLPSTEIKNHEYEFLLYALETLESKCLTLDLQIRQIRTYFESLKKDDD